MEEFKNFAAKVMGMADEEIASLLDDDGNIKPEAFTTLSEKDKERVKRMKEEHKEDLTAKFNEGHAKAKKEERSKFENEIREQFGVESKNTGTDLIKDVISTGSKDDVKKHPDYIALERQLHSDYIPKEDFDVVKGEYDTFRQQVEKDRVFGRVKQDAKKMFYGLNPVLSKDKQRAMNQENDFLSKLERYNYQVQDDGNHLILDGEGKRLVNENMNPITFPELVKNLTHAHFDVQEQEPVGNSGVEGSPPVEGGTRYKDAKEFYAAYSNEGDPAKAAKMYEQAKADGTI